MMEAIRSSETAVLQLILIANVTSSLILSTLIMYAMLFRNDLLQLLSTANVTSSLILSTRMMEAIRSSETSDLTRATQRHIPEDGIIIIIYK
jgi:hypothetical protein